MRENIVRAFQEQATSAPVMGRDIAAETSNLPDLLASLYTRGRAAYPKLAVSEQAFGRCLARAMASPSFQGVETLAVADLYLGCACADNVRGAAAAFETRFAKIIRRAASRVLPTRDEREEAEQ